MKKKRDNINDETESCEMAAESIDKMAGKILDSALCLIDKRISFASDNTEVLDNLTEYINNLDKEDMSKSEKNYLIQKINELKIAKLSEITSVITLCKDKLKAEDSCGDNEIVFVVDYGDEKDEIHIKEGLNEN